MLLDLQQAMAEYTADADACRAVRADPSRIHPRYRLTTAERRQLVAWLQHPGMAANCMIYRMNRLAPVVMNLDRTCRALGPALKDIVADYWREHPAGIAHFYLESDRFAGWLRARIDGGMAVAAEVHELLTLEQEEVRAALAASLKAETA